MKIITKVVIDMESGRTLHEEAFEYHGQLTLAGGGSQKSGGSQPTYILPGLLPGIQGAAQNSIINPAMGTPFTVPWYNSLPQSGPNGPTNGGFFGSTSTTPSNINLGPFPKSLTDLNMDRAVQQIRGGYGARGLANSGISIAGEQNAIGQLALQGQQQDQGALTNLLSAGTGQTTAPTKTSSGVSIICTFLNSRGLLDDETYRADCYYGKTQVPSEAIVGYHLWAEPLVKLMKVSPLLTRIIAPLGIAWATTMRSRVLGDCEEHWLGRALLKYGVPICAFLGKHRKALQWKHA